MENPATWGPAEQVIRKVLDDDHQLSLSPEPICGLSLERRITDALRAAGLLKEIQPVRSELPADTMIVLHKMRDSFVLAKDRLRETGTISQDEYEHLVGEFFDGYQQVKRLLKEPQHVVQGDQRQEELH